MKKIYGVKRVDCGDYYQHFEDILFMSTDKEFCERLVKVIVKTTESLTKEEAEERRKEDTFIEQVYKISDGFDKITNGYDVNTDLYLEVVEIPLISTREEFESLDLDL